MEYGLVIFFTCLIAFLVVGIMRRLIPWLDGLAPASHGRRAEARADVHPPIARTETR